MDQAKNFARATVSGTYSASDTAITVSDGHAARLPTVPFNATWYDATTYPNPVDDPNVEIVRVTAINGNVLTMTRGYDDTVASTKNTAGKTYLLEAGLTADVINNQLPEIVDAINFLFKAVNRPVWIDFATGRMRVNLSAITSGLTLGNITTVGAITSLNQMGGHAIKPVMLDSLDRTAWYQSTRSKIT